MKLITSVKKISVLILIGMVVATGLLGVGSTAFAQLLPTVTVPLLPSPYVLNGQSIQKNVTGTWDIPFFVPPNTQSQNFVLQINGTTLTGIPQAQILNGQLVFKAPDSAFATGGTAMIGLVQKNPFKVVSLNAALVVSQGIQLSPFIFNEQALVQNSDGSWTVGYYAPQNTAASDYSLTIGSNTPLTNGLAGYGGIIFKAPEAWFSSGSTLTLTLKQISTGKTVASTVAFVPITGPSPYVLDPATIKQNTNQTWDIGYTTPTNINASHFSLRVGNMPIITNGAIIGGKLFFKAPKDSLIPGSQIVLVLKNETTGQVRATNTITVPVGIGAQFILETPIVKNSNNTWKVSYKIPPNIASQNYELLIGPAETLVSGGLIIAGKLVFEVPQGLISSPSDSSGLLLKNKSTGKAYRPDGTEITHTTGTPSAGTYPANALSVAIPESDMSISQNQITLKVRLTLLKDVPALNTTYIWKKKGATTTNEKSLVVVAPGGAGLKAGTTQTISISFPNLVASQLYTLSIQDSLGKTILGSTDIKTLSPTETPIVASTATNQVDPSVATPTSEGTIINVETSALTNVPTCEDGFCYETYSGVSEALGEQFNQIKQTSEISGFINAIIAFVTATGGVIAVIMIMYEGFRYMSTDNVSAKGDARTRIVHTVAGLLLLLSIYTLLRTINPDLLVLMPSIEPVALQTGAKLTPKEFEDITGEAVGKPSDYDNLAKKVASDLNSDYCALRVIIQNETGGNALVVGQDENVPSAGVASRRAFIASGQKYSGATFTPSDANLKNNKFCNDAAGCVGKVPAPTSPTLGLDWRFSKGIGLTQITFYPDDYDNFTIANYKPKLTNKNIVPKRTFNFPWGETITVTALEMFKPEANLRIAAKLWNSGIEKCKTPYGAFFTYVCGQCSCSGAYAQQKVGVRINQYNVCKKQNP